MEKMGKIYVRLPQERIDEVKALADEIGMKYTQFGGMLIWMGFRAYLRQVNPEKLFSPEMLAEMGKAYEKQDSSELPKN
mgnify:CR=1 FL=1